MVPHNLPSFHQASACLLEHENCELYWVSGWTHGFPPPPKELPDNQFGKDWPVSGIISSERRRWQKLFLICSLFLQNQKVGNWFRVLAENYVSATEVQEQFFSKNPLLYCYQIVEGFWRRLDQRFCRMTLKLWTWFGEGNFQRGQLLTLSTEDT